MVVSYSSTKDRIKITYNHNGHTWYAEQTAKGLKKGLGWFQWGETQEYLGMSVDSTERLVYQWMLNYKLSEED